MAAVNSCPECGTPLPPDAPRGFCPKCLMEKGMTPPVGVEALDDDEALLPLEDTLDTATHFWEKRGMEGWGAYCWSTRSRWGGMLP